MKNNKLICYCLFILVFILFIFYLDKFYFARNNQDDVIKIDTLVDTRVDTLWKDTIIFKKEFVPKKVFITKRDTFYDKQGDVIEYLTENKQYQDTIICGKDTAELQIFTSGIKSNVDSLSLNLKKSEIIRTNTIEITKYVEKPKKLFDRIHIQPQITSGYDLLNKQWGITCGIGIGIEI